MKATILTLVLINCMCLTNIYAQIDAQFESSNITVNTLVASSFINDNEGWIADDAGTLFHTSDAGLSWNSISSDINFLNLVFINAQFGYGITEDAAYKTKDGGTTWSTLSLPAKIGTSIYFLDNQTGFISGFGEIYKTTDGGDSWTTVSTEGVSFDDFFFMSSSIGVAAADDDDSYQSIWRTTDGGLTWSNVFSEENYFINAVWFTDENTGWAVGYYDKPGRGKQPVINRSIDGGLTWLNVYINRHPGEIRGQAFIDIRFKNEMEGFALASYSENVITLDGGVTWTLTYDENKQIVPSYGIYKCIDGRSELYLIGKDGLVTKWE